MNEAAVDGLTALIARLNELGGVAERAAPLVATELDRLLRAQIKAGTGPDGTPWQPKKDGGKPLQDVKVSVRAIGTTVIARLDGPAVLHDQGRARGGVRRKILPSRDLPQPIIEAIRSAVKKAI